MNGLRQQGQPTKEDKRGSLVGHFRPWLIPGAVWLLLLLGCSSMGLAERAVIVSTPIPTRPVVATFTPTPDVLEPLIVITPPRGGTPGVIILPPNVTPNLIFPPAPTALPTATPLPAPATDTPIPTETPPSTATSTPTPYVVVESGFVSMRQGPGANYPLIAQLAPDIPVSIVGKNTLGDWLQICCVNGESVWVAASHIRIVNDISQVALFSAEPAPTPTFTPTPTETPTPTPYVYPFERAEGPLFFPTRSEFLTIWVLLYVGDRPSGSLENDPAPGYFLEVEFADSRTPDLFFDRPNTNVELPSFDTPPEYDYRDPKWKFHWTASEGAGNRKPYNYKYEHLPYNPPRAEYPGATFTPTLPELLGGGIWRVWVKDGAGNQLSEAVTFVMDSTNPNREIYIAWRRIR